jgi:pimeloyl-ACP methyl ester carboxylesterase
VLDEVPRLWPAAAVDVPLAVPVTRLSTHVLRLSDGHRIGIMVGGRGIPLIVAHGFSFAGMLYVQSLARLASMGFRVVAVDMAGHGGTAALANRGFEIDEYRRFMGRVLDELGVRRAVLAGHSLGGRLVAEVAAAEPDRAVALLLVDAAVGSTWDDLAAFARWAPPALGLVGATLAGDTLRTLFLSGDQAQKLQSLAVPQAVANAVAPWRLVAPALSVLLAPGSGATLDRLREADLSVVVLHGDRDPVVPLAAARDAARRTGAELVVVHGATHSWLLEDPETLRAIVAELLADGLGSACATALVEAGVDPDDASLAELERAFYAPDAVVVRLSSGPGRIEVRPGRPPRFTWSRLGAGRSSS